MPTPRTFKYQELTAPKYVGEGLLDIPHPLILRYKSPEELIAEFEKNFGVKPTGVVLPAIATDGLMYPCEKIELPLSRYTYATGKFQDFQTTVADFASQEAIKTIYLSIEPTLQFVTTDALHVVDIVGDGSSQVCIGNQRTQELISTILGIGIDKTLAILEEKKSQAKLAGAVIDCVDLWPQGARNDRLELTCFCESCLQYFKEESRSPELIDKFRTFPNPWNLVLKDRGDGIGYIDDLPKGVTETQIIGLSRQKGFLEIFKETSEQELIQQAGFLLDYMQLRHNQTVLALHSIFDEAFKDLEKPELKRIVLLEGIHYDWTSGLQLTRLDDPDEGIPKFDEIWFNPTSSDLYTRNVQFRSYMWRRSRYLIDAFFQEIANAADPVKRNTTGIARFSEEDLRKQLLKRFLGALNTSASSLTSLAALPELQGGTKGSQRVGFVGVAFLSEEQGRQFINTLPIAESGVVTGGRLSRERGPSDLLDLFRQLSESKDSK